MKVVFDNLAKFLSISPNQTPVLPSVCLVPAGHFRRSCFFSSCILSQICSLYNVHVLTPTCTVQYVISCAVNIQLQLYTGFLTMRSKHASSKILNDIGRNSLLENRKKIANFLMRTFTCRSTFLYVSNPQGPVHTYCRMCLFRFINNLLTVGRVRFASKIILLLSNECVCCASKIFSFLLTCLLCFEK